jgi:hypothetical protein
MPGTIITSNHRQNTHVFLLNHLEPTQTPVPDILQIHSILTRFGVKTRLGELFSLHNHNRDDNWEWT